MDGIDKKQIGEVTNKTFTGFIGDAVESFGLGRAFKDHKSGELACRPPPQLARLYRWNTHVLARVKSTQKTSKAEGTLQGTWEEGGKGKA
jgi:hypothetical protein